MEQSFPDQHKHRPYYRQALTIFNAHQQAVDALGAPIELGQVDLGDTRYAWETKDEANVSL